MYENLEKKIRDLFGLIDDAEELKEHKWAFKKAALKTIRYNEKLQLEELEENWPSDCAYEGVSLFNIKRN